MTDRSLSRDDRSVSEMLGFVLLFSIVLLSIVSVSIVGMNMLREGRDTVTTSNVQASFERMAVTVSDMYQERADRRAVSLRTSVGQISFGDPVEIVVQRTDAGSPTTLARIEYEPIVFSLDESRLIYSGTAVIREEANGAAVVDPPGFRLSDDAVLLPLIATNATGATSSASGRMSIRFVKHNETIIYGREPAGFNGWNNHEIRLVVRPATVERARAWNRTLADNWSDCSFSPSPPEVTCEYDPDANARVMVHNVSIDYALST